LLALTVSVWTLTTFALAGANPVTTDIGSTPDHPRDIQWGYWSPLCVLETITDLGGGFYEYSYSFENVDAAHIWHFGVYSVLTDLTPTASWSTHPLWMTGASPLDGVHPAYDARNLDPQLQWVSNTWGPDWPNTTDPINPGETVSGFSYIAPGLDTAPKYYFYETVESGYAGETGVVAAVGQTCTEPVSVESHSWGGIKTLYRN
jgi:hypothetical protein